MVDHALRRVLRTFRFAVLAGIAGLSLLGIAIAVAAAQYRACGPSALDAALAHCSAGAYLLVAAYGVLSIALVLGAASLTLLWRLRRLPRNGLP